MAKDSEASDSRTPRRKETGKSPQPTEDLCRALLENSLDVTAVVGADGTIHYESQSIKNLLGYEAEDRIGASVFDHLHPDDLARVEAAFEELMRNPGGRVLTEIRARHADGSWRTLQIAGRNLLDNPAIGGIIASFRDVTELKQGEEALREPEEKWRTLVETAPERIVTVDRNGAILSANRVSPGHTTEEVIGTSLYAFVLPRYRKTVREAIRSVFRSGKTESWEAEAIGLDKKTSWFESIAAPIVRDGKVVAAIVSSLDVTQRKAAEEHLKRQEEYFRSLIENSLDAISVLDRDGTHRYASASYERVMGYKPGAEGEKHGLARVFTVDLPRAADAFARLLQDPGGTIHEEIRVWHEDGSLRTVEVVSQNLLDEPAVQGIVSNFRDITLRKEAEEELRKAHDELERRVEERTSELTKANSALRESERRFRDLANLLPQIVFEIDRRGNLVFANHAVLKAIGYDQTDVAKGVNAFDTLAPEDRARARRNMKQVLGGEKLGGNEYTMVRKDGTTFPVIVYSSPIFENDRPTGIRGIAIDVTESKRLELELRASEQRFKALTENSADVIVLVGNDGTIKYESPAVERVLGYTPEELIGREAFFGLHPDCLEKAAEDFGQLMVDPSITVQTELVYQHKDGSWRNIEATGRNLIDHPAVAGMVVNFRDITERKRMEEELRREEEHFRAIIDKSLDMITILNADGTIRYQSPSFGRIMGYEEGAQIGESGFERVHPDDLPKVYEGFAELIGNPGHIIRTEMRYPHGDGSWRVIEATGQNLLDDPAVAGIVINFRDITERKEAQEALEREEKYYRALIENSLEVVVVMDGDGTIRYESPSATRVTGYTSEERLGKSIFEMVHPDDIQGLVGRLTGLLSSPGRVEKAEFRGLWKDGWHHVESSAHNLLHDPAVGGIVVNFRDVTERRRSEEQTQELYEHEKELRERLEVEMRRRVEFTRALAHELKTPLTAVLASSDLLVSELEDETLLGLARNIRQGASNLDDRIDELLDLARGEVGMLQVKAEPIDMLQLLREAADRMIPRAVEHGQSLIPALPPKLPTVQADAARLEQVVSNLLDNAIKFTPRGGKITLRAKESKGHVTVEVQDTGRGIPKEARDRLFEPYQRLDSDRENLSGLGLGLSLSKTLIELHGGTIWVKSRVGHGSTFGFTIPLLAAQSQDQEPEQPRKLWKVLIIEDEREIVDFVALNFRLRWPEAELVSTGLGEEGVQMVESEDPNVVILDLGLPDISGFEVLRQIRLFSAVPVIVLTVKADEADMVKGLEWGANDYVIKPFRQNELVARLKVQIRKKVEPDEEAPIVCGSLRLDPSTFQLMYGSTEISLTIVEGRIIEHLMRNAGHVVTHASLAEAVWGEDYPGAIDSLRVYIRYIRQKIEADPSHPKLILTKAGVGYSLARLT